MASPAYHNKTAHNDSSTNNRGDIPVCTCQPVVFTVVVLLETVVVLVVAVLPLGMMKRMMTLIRTIATTIPSSTTRNMAATTVLQTNTGTTHRCWRFQRRCTLFAKPPYRF